MMKKLIAIVLAVALLLSLSACGENAYEYAGVSGGAAASDAVYNNGSPVVQKGNYYYYINTDESTTSLNAFGSTYNGTLIRSNLDGSNKVVVQPKLVSNLGGVGLYIFGDTIYYTSPSDSLDKNGSAQTSYLDIMSCKLDGTGTKKLVTLSSTKFALKMYDIGSDVYCVYTNAANAVASIKLTDSKPKSKEILASFSSVVYGEDAIYYSVPKYLDEGEKVSGRYSEVYKLTADGETKTKLFDGDTSGSNKYTLTLQKIVDGRLYYLKNDAVLTLENALYSISLSTLNDETRCTTNAITATGFIPYTYNGERGVIITSSALGIAFVGEKGTIAQVYGSTQTLGAISGSYLYYLVENSTSKTDNLYRIDIAKAIETKTLATAEQLLLLSTETDDAGKETKTYDTIYGGNFDGIRIIGNKLFYYSNDDAANPRYLFMVDLSSGERTDLAHKAS